MTLQSPHANQQDKAVLTAKGSLLMIWGSAPFLSFYARNLMLIKQKPQIRIVHNFFPR